MSIGKRAGPAEDEDLAAWRVQVSVTVVELVPKAVLHAWLVLETMARANGYLWACNRTLTGKLGFTSIKATQQTLLDLERLGIVERAYDPHGHRNRVTLLRRLSEDLKPEVWAAMQAKAEVSKKQTTRPKTRVAPADQPLLPLPDPSRSPTPHPETRVARHPDFRVAHPETRVAHKKKNEAEEVPNNNKAAAVRVGTTGPSPLAAAIDGVVVAVGLRPRKTKTAAVGAAS